MSRTIETTRFGIFLINEADILHFPEGIPGFEIHKEWVIAGEDFEPIKWLQSLEDADVALPVTHPSFVMDTYAPRFADEDLEEVHEGSPETLVLLLVLSIPEGEPWNITANLRAPIIIQHLERKGKQVICLNEDYPLRAHVFPEDVREKLHFRHAAASAADSEAGEGR